MKKLILFACLSLLTVAHATAQDYTLTRGLPGIIFGYPSDVPLINDQSQVATVVWPNLAEVTYMGQYTIQAIDGVRLPDRIRSSPFRRHEVPCFAVDLLPGRHTLSVAYSEYIWQGLPGKKYYNVATPAPVTVAVELEAGDVYQLKAVLSSGAFTGFAVDSELTDPGIVARLAQSRTTSRLAYTPLAGQAAATQPVEPVAARRTVQPAAPRQAQPAATPATVAAAPSTAPAPAEATASRRTVQPAAPRRQAQPVTAPASVATPSTQPVTAAAPQSAAHLPNGVARVHIYRVGRTAGSAIGYDIHLGNEVVWRAKNKSRATIELSEAGFATLWAKTESRVDLPLDIVPGREYYVRCGIKMGALVGRPELELVDAVTGKAEFDAIPTPAQQVVIPASAPAKPVTAPEPPVEAVAPVASIEVAVPAAPIETVASPAPPVPEKIEKPVPVLKGIGNGTLEILSVALPDSVVFRLAPDVEITQGTLEVNFISGTTSVRSAYWASGTFRVRDLAASEMILIFTDQTTLVAKEFDFPAGFKPKKIRFTVAGEEMTYDIARSAWDAAPPAPVAAPASTSVQPPAPEPEPAPAAWEALSSGWEGDNFTAAFKLNGPGTGYAHGTWQFEIKPPFPHKITGLNDSYVQTAIGILLMGMEPAGGVSWLLRAAKQNQPDAIMMLAIAYANMDEVKNTQEAERWFRRAVELGNAEAQTKLNDLLGGKSVGSSFSTSFGYNFGFKKLP